MSQNDPTDNSKYYEDDGRIVGLAKYLALNDVPRSIAKHHIANGYKHGQPDKSGQPGKPYEGKAVISVRQLANALGFASHTSLNPENNRLSVEGQYEIRTLYRIPETSACWRYFIARQVANFAHAFENELHPPEPTTAAPALTDMPSVGQWVLREDLSAETEVFTTRLAYLTLRTGQNVPLPLGNGKLGFDLNCTQDVSDGLVTSVKRCFVQFDLGSARTGPMATRVGHPVAAVFDTASFKAENPDPRRPSWLVEAVGTDGIGNVASMPLDFLPLFNVKPGAPIKATVRAVVKDILTTFVIPEGVRDSVARRKIKKRLEELKLEGGDDGEADIARAEIQLIATEK